MRLPFIEKVEKIFPQIFIITEIHVGAMETPRSLKEEIKKEKQKDDSMEVVGLALTNWMTVIFRYALFSPKISFLN